MSSGKVHTNVSKPNASPKKQIPGQASQSETRLLNAYLGREAGSSFSVSQLWCPAPSHPRFQDRGYSVETYGQCLDNTESLEAGYLAFISVNYYMVNSMRHRYMLRYRML